MDVWQISPKRTQSPQVLCGIGVLLLCGCGEGLPTAKPPIEQDSSVPIVAPPAQAPQNKTLMQRHVSTQDECPKLVQKRVDSTTVSRQDSILGNTCDYFIYPAIGDVVSVSVSDDRMKPYLNVPYYHDFANGNYQVVANGRHVIRLQYNALERKPDVMDYVFMVEIKPK